MRKYAISLVYMTQARDYIHNELWLCNSKTKNGAISIEKKMAKKTATGILIMTTVLEVNN